MLEPGGILVSREPLGGGILRRCVMTEVSEKGLTGRGAGEYEFARWRVEKKRRIRIDLVTYVVVNLFLIVVWAVTGFGYFWPGWVLAGWGVLLGLDIWSAYSRRPITDDDIQRELRTGR
jgi:hypothetical protein